MDPAVLNPFLTRPSAACRGYFCVVGSPVGGLGAGIGIATLWRESAREMGVGLAKASPILSLALIPLVFNFSWASRADDYAARDWSHNLLMSVEPYGVLFTNGDNDTFPLWYLQEVEGIRRDVTVIVTSYLNTEWYTGQLKRLPPPCPAGVAPSPPSYLAIFLGPTGSCHGPRSMPLSLRPTQLRKGGQTRTVLISDLKTSCSPTRSALKS